MSDMPALTRLHRTRLMQVWRSAGWPCKDGIEIDLLAAGLLGRRFDAEGRETLVVTEAGIDALARARRQGNRALSMHDRLAIEFAAQLRTSGRIVWRELSLRALIEDGAAGGQTRSMPTLAPDLALEPLDALNAPANVWRMARPDLFSVRNTTVEAYLQPMVHEVKASRADLLSDLRHAAKRQAYQWLCSECYYVFPAGIAEADEIPEQFGVWVFHGGIDEGRFELLRPARHNHCELPFAVWLTLAKATPWEVGGDGSDEAAQSALGDEGPAEERS